MSRMLTDVDMNPITQFEEELATLNTLVWLRCVRVSGLRQNDSLRGKSRVS
jgi:hypothetical protein